MKRNTGYIKKVNSLFRLDRAIQIVLHKNLDIKSSESLLIIYDKKKVALAKRFYTLARKSLDNVEIIKISISKVSGQEPSKKVAQALLKYDTAIFLTEKSLSHTKARRDATKKGIRIASMPGITENIMRRSIDIDYIRLKKESVKLVAMLTRAKNARVTSALGTDITFSLANRKAGGASAGIFNKRGKWGNLPEGEAFIAPVERTANGYFVVDGSVAGFGKINHPLIFFVENGFVVRITNGKKPHKIEALLNKVGKNARNIAELGIGLNRKAKITGVVLEDEKVYGTCHIALGNNLSFGGKIDVPIHIDCVIKKPTVYLDNRVIMKKGKLFI